MPAMRKIIVVEDDADIRDLIIYALKVNGFKAEGFETGREFFESNEIPALVLLDIMLPEADGLSILKKIRESEKYAEIPVIILSAKASELDKAKGLDNGADDYVTKPFGVTELISRINAVLRRSGAVNFVDIKDGALIYKNISVNKERRTVFVGGEKVILTYKEYELLSCLILNVEEGVRRDKIIETVWGHGFVGESSRTIDMHIKTLRQKLGAAGKYIKTIRNIGYKIGE